MTNLNIAQSSKLKDTIADFYLEKGDNIYKDIPSRKSL